MLRTRLIDEIERKGPMPFEVFMEASLYDPVDGFFGSGPLRSVAGGDFLTSPEVSPWFGRTLARCVADVRTRVGDPFCVVEVGAGSGSLLRPMRESLGPGVDYWAVDASPAARSALIPEFGGDRVVSRLEEVPLPVRGVIVANELLDNMPVALVVKGDGGWEERWVGVSGGELCLVAAPVRAQVASWTAAHGGEVPAGGMVEVQLAALEWVEQAVAAIEDGALLVFDYGGTKEELEPRRTRGTLRTYRSHHLGPDPLLAPGETDVTVDVNFSALEASVRGSSAGVAVDRQDDFLSRWGLSEVISEMRRAELAAAKAGDTIEQLRLRSERTDAQTLLHPRGLGDFRVLTVTIGRAGRMNAGTSDGAAGVETA
jgi:SAM-dependent MidA family methyltransferase